MLALTTFWPYIRGHLPSLLLLLFIMLVRPIAGGVGFTLVVPLIQHLNISDETGNPRLASLLAYLPGQWSLASILMLFLLLMLLIAALNYIQAVTSQRMEQGILSELRASLYEKFMTAEAQYLLTTHRADYTRILTEEVDAVITALDRVLQLVGQFLLIAVYTALSLYLSPWLTIAAIVLGTLLLAGTIPVQRRISKTGSRHLDASQLLYRQASEQLTGIKAIKSAGAEAQLSSAFRQTAEALGHEERHYARLSALTQLVHSAISAAAFVTLAYIAFTLLAVDIATLAILALVFSRLLPQVARLHVHFQMLAYLMPSLNSVARLHQLVNEYQEPAGHAAPFDLSVGLHLDHLSYRYPATDEMVLMEVSATLMPGQIVAITGSSGIGKSTLADIIAGITLPTTGQLRAGDQAITASTLRSWRQQVTYLPQVPFIVDGTVKENLNLLRRHAASGQELNAAINQAGAAFLFSLPDGLETHIGEDGITLSGGERQRLQLARALLNDRPVLILDETTSNLDLETEKAIITTLKSLRENHLIIVISHRPSMVGMADQTLTIQQTDV